MTRIASTDPFFDLIDDFAIEHIAGFLCDCDNLRFLTHLAQTCKRLNKICARMINAYDEECEARCVDLEEDANHLQRKVWQNERGELHRCRDRPAMICANGDRRWFLNGKPRRMNGLPTIIHANGDCEWQSSDGKTHRDGDKPAFIRKGTRMWFKNGVCHRDGDKPAFIDEHGTRGWFKNGEYYRDNKPAIVCFDGYMEWRKRGLPHRDDDYPATIRENGTCEWRKNGILHRDAGFAFTCADGRQERWINGKYVAH